MNKPQHIQGDLAPTTPRVDPRIKDVWPEDDQASCVLGRVWRNWTFSYMNRVLDKGSKQGADAASLITPDDLYRVPKSMESQHLSKLFHQIHVNTPPSYPNRVDDDSKSATHSPKSSTTMLLSTLWELAKPTFLAAGLCELLVVFCGTALPLLVMLLLAVLEDHPQENIISEGMPLAIGIFVVSVLNGFGNHRHRHLAMKTGVALRAAVVNVIYQHILILSPEGKKGLTSGEVTNLVAVDAQKIFEVTQDGHLIWALPLSVVLASFFLYRTLGPSTLVGIVVLVGFVPLIQYVSSHMLATRQRRTKYTDARVELVSSMLQGIKVTKLNNFESKYHSQVSSTREKELHHLSREMAILGLTLAMVVASPVLATGATFATYVLIDEDNTLNASDTFGVLLLFSALRFPINYAGRLVGKAAQAISAAGRISEFLERPTYSSNSSESPKKTGSLEEFAQLGQHEVPLVLSRASFRVGGGDTDSQSSEMSRFTVSEFSFSLEKGQVLAVCGPTGSGKSTLLHGILGEAEALGNTVATRHGGTSYAPQSPFILNQSVRDNILFGLPFEQERYDRVLDACCLRQDLEQFGQARDLTEIGERGATMSGGQKQRISLARAAYAESSLYILDDPFSALDAATGKMVFERLISSSDALLKDAAVVLVTHASHFITSNVVDKILLIVDGGNKFLGSWDDFTSFVPPDDKTRRVVEHIQSSARDNSEDEGDENSEEDKNDEVVKEKNTPSKLIGAEEREHGVSSLKTWLLWFERAGGIPFIAFQFLLMTLDRFVYVAVEWFLARWTSAADGPVDMLWMTFPAQTDGLPAQSRYLKLYAVLTFVSCIATIARSQWAMTGGVRATRKVFANMLSSVLRAPVSYFETVPMGRILNRFTYDTDVTDVTLTQAMSMFMVSCSWYVAGVIIQCTILPLSALSVCFVTVMYWKLMLVYRKTGPDLQRLDALSRSPLQSMVSECLEGTASIRIFHQGYNFLDRFQGVVDKNSSALLNFVSAQRWLGARMELLASSVVLTTVVLIVCLNNRLGLEPGLVGLLIMWSVNFTMILNIMVDTFSEAEAAITAIERVDKMAVLPSEKPMETDVDHLPKLGWPEQGVLKFDEVCLRYREGLPLALNGLSFEIPSAKTCGVVGRTGAGKSSISVALFRLIEPESGKITLDGVDLGLLGLSDVRGGGMSIIPQDPFLAGATLRECLDPFRHRSDAEIVDALRAVRLESSKETDDAAFLSTKLEEGGSNYSVGERQLLNLARALLSQPRLLVLDEATASIDGETDAFIQQMLRTRFPDTTLLTIAHRLNTIMDNDFILVMDAGHAVEFGAPSDLLENPRGVLSELVDATGVDSSRALREMAKAAQRDRSSKETLGDLPAASKNSLHE